jgi:hypothetical protein
VHRPVDGAVDHDVRGLHFAVDARIGRHRKGAGLVGHRADVASDHAVDP